MNANTPNPDRTKEIQQTVDQMAREFMKCHDFLASSTHRLAELLPWNWKLANPRAKPLAA